MQQTLLHFPSCEMLGVPAGTEPKAWPLRGPWAWRRVWGKSCGVRVGPERTELEQRLPGKGFKKRNRVVPGRGGCG